MKKYILVLLILFSGNVYSQINSSEIPKDSLISYQNNKVVLNPDFWKTISKEYVKVFSENKLKDSIIILQDSLLKQYKEVNQIYSNTIQRDSNIISLYKDNINRSNKENDIKFFNGVFAGISIYYKFGDEYKRFIDGMNYSIYINLELQLKDFKIIPEYNLPLYKESGVIKLNISKKIF